MKFFTSRKAPVSASVGGKSERLVDGGGVKNLIRPSLISAIKTRTVDGVQGDIRYVPIPGKPFDSR